jgi:hypothetical protein
MSKFYVGQRVRLVASEGGNPHLVGAETRVTSLRDAGGYYLGLIHPESGNPYWAAAHQLEPILLSGAAPSEYTFHELMDKLRAGEVAAV